ncbi:hypothetical protein SAMN02910368_02614 [Lachnospiraceae bacterium G11]|nr:hypothetical protein SAMN02910368_02614 [Lachnospiraceae bacterium G11]
MNRRRKMANKLIREVCNELLDVLKDLCASECYTMIPDNLEATILEALEYYNSRVYNVINKAEKAAWYLTARQHRKLIRLCYETKGFIDDPNRCVRRWSEIEPRFDTLSRLVDFIPQKAKIVSECFRIFELPIIPEDWEEEQGRFKESELDYLENDFYLYNSGDYSNETVGEMLELFIGKWFLTVVRHDFRACFRNRFIQHEEGTCIE